MCDARARMLSLLGRTPPQILYAAENAAIPKGAKGSKRKSIIMDESGVSR